MSGGRGDSDLFKVSRAFEPAFLAAFSSISAHVCFTFRIISWPAVKNCLVSSSSDGSGFLVSKVFIGTFLNDRIESEVPGDSMLFRFLGSIEVSIGRDGTRVPHCTSKNKFQKIFSLKTRK